MEVQHKFGSERVLVSSGPDTVRIMFFKIPLGFLDTSTGSYRRVDLSTTSMTRFVTLQNLKTLVVGTSGKKILMRSKPSATNA